MKSLSSDPGVKDRLIIDLTAYMLNGDSKRFLANII